MIRFNKALQINEKYEIALHNKIKVLNAIQKFSEAAIEFFVVLFLFLLN